jgi:hypothetical protein
MLRKVRNAARRLRSWPEGRYLRRPRYDAVVVDVEDFPYMGFGATVGWVHMAQVAADAVGAPLLFVNPDRWPFGGRRPECALDRFLELAVVDPAELEDRRWVPFQPGLGDKLNMRRWGFVDELHWPHNAFGYRDGFDSLEDYRRSVLAREYRPTEFAMEEIAGRIGFLPPRYAAWHVRRGDKVRGPNREDDAVGLESYVAATAELLERHPAPPTHLVICTDSPDVLAEAARSEPLRDLGLEIVFDPEERRWDGYCDIHRAGGVESIDDMLEEAITAQKIIEILRGADLLVGCNSSCLFRVPAMLTEHPHVASLSENKVYRKYFPI